MVADAAELAAGSGMEPEAAGPVAHGQRSEPPDQADSVSAPWTESKAHLPRGSFDCVIDTFGLCSHHSPVAVLQVRHMCHRHTHALL